MKNYWKKKLTQFKPKNTDSYITGLLNPIEWDERDQIKRFSIFSDFDEDIIITNYSNMKKLKELLNQRVLAIGKTFIKDGEKYIKLKSIRKLQDTNPSVLKNKYDDYNIEELSLAYPYAKYINNDYFLSNEAC